jgi:hypothetical protein
MTAEPRRRIGQLNEIAHVRNMVTTGMRGSEASPPNLAESVGTLMRQSEPSVDGPDFRSHPTRGAWRLFASGGAALNRSQLSVDLTTREAKS